MPKLYSKNETVVQNTISSENLKPRLHVINTLLNYSKSLQVNTMKNGRKVALNMN
jgi:hypothetical protein